MSKAQTKEIHLTAKDFRLEWYSGQGAGGQHRNKHMNCCRITHIESSITESGTASRSRVENQRSAFTRLANRVIAYYRGDAPGRREDGERVRTYHEPRNDVKDYASGERRTYRSVVYGASLEDLIDARAKAIRSGA